MRKKREGGREGMRCVEQVSISSSPGQCSEMTVQPPGVLVRAPLSLVFFPLAECCLSTGERSIQ